VRAVIQVTSALMVVLGLLIAGRGLLDGAWFAVLVGLLFIAAGAGRLYVERHR
jgi:hypothetical protein